jgi:hypothetical protein
MGFGNVGQVWNLASFETYLGDITLKKWTGVTIHHTAAPSLAQRPTGLTIQHIRNMQYGYQNPTPEERRKPWTSGPRLYTDDDQILGMCPLNERGVHAVSFNATYIGIEMLGNYDLEDPKTGRGKRVVDISAATTALLLRKLGLEANTTTITFHRDDPKTRKTCPGTQIIKPWFLDLVTKAMQGVTVGTALKVVMLAENSVIDCNPRLENDRTRVNMRPVCEALKMVLPTGAALTALNPEVVPPGVTRVDLRPLVEGNGWELLAHKLAEDGKIYLRKKV